MLLQPEKASVITLTCVFLHNFLRTSRTSGATQGCFDSFSVDGAVRPGSWSQDSQSIASQLPLRKSSEIAKHVRDEFANYFMTIGKAEWQEKY